MDITTAGWIVGGFFVCGFGLMSWLSGSIERRPIIIGFVLTMAGGAMFAWGYTQADPAISFADIPLAFIEIIAVILGR